MLEAGGGGLNGRFQDWLVGLVWTQVLCPQVTVCWTHPFGSLPAPQNKNAEADVPKTGVAMHLWNKIPSELPAEFFKPGEFQLPTLEQPPDGITAQTRP